MDGFASSSSSRLLDVEGQYDPTLGEYIHTLHAADCISIRQLEEHSKGWNYTHVSRGGQQHSVGLPVSIVAGSPSWNLALERRIQAARSSPPEDGEAPCASAALSVMANRAVSGSSRQPLPVKPARRRRPRLSASRGSYFVRARYTAQLSESKEGEKEEELDLTDDSEDSDAEPGKNDFNPHRGRELSSAREHLTFERAGLGRLEMLYLPQELYRLIIGPVAEQLSCYAGTGLLMLHRPPLERVESDIRAIAEYLHTIPALSNCSLKELITLGKVMRLERKRGRERGE